MARARGPAPSLHISAFQDRSFLIGGGPLTSRFRAETGFANRPLALRRCLIEILSRRNRLTARDLAGIAYGRRSLIVRPGHRRHVTSSQLVATRRAFVPWLPRAGLRSSIAGDAGRCLYCGGRSSDERRRNRRGDRDASGGDPGSASLKQTLPAENSPSRRVDGSWRRELSGAFRSRRIPFVESAPIIQNGR